LSRPTRDDLIHAAGLLEELAMRYDSRNNPNGWPDLYKLLDLLVWLDVDYDLAKRSAVYGPGGERSPEGGGTIGSHTVGRHGLNRPVEQRFHYLEAMTREHRGIVMNDPLVKALADLRATWRTRVGTMVDKMQDEARHAANWPMHTEQTG
jgi:hypothetical protein